MNHIMISPAITLCMMAVLHAQPYPYPSSAELAGEEDVVLTYFSTDYNLNLTKLFVPINYSPPSGGEDSDCYYLWDSESDTGERLLGLPPSQIMYMYVSDEVFEPDEYIIPERD